MSLMDLHDVAPAEILPSPSGSRLEEPLVRLIGRTRAEKLLASIGATGFRSMTFLEIAYQCGFTFDLAERIVAARDLAEVFVDEESVVIRGQPDVLSLLPPGFRSSETEELLAFVLDQRNVVRERLLLAKGGKSHVSVTVADVLRPIVRLGAVAFILVHSHPSNCAMPSQDDVLLTNRVSKSAHVLGLTLVDHLIVTRDAHVSFLEAGLLLEEHELAL